MKTVKEAANALNTSEHYVRQLVKNFARAAELKSLKPSAPAPVGLDGQLLPDATGRNVVLITDESISAYKTRMESGVRAGGGSRPGGAKSMKGIFTEAQVKAVEAMGIKLSSATNYSTEKSKAYRIKRNARLKAEAESE